MRRIINGNRYDTEKSHLIGCWSSFSSPSDFNYIQESLYITPRSKQYFLAGEGGANSKYSIPTSQNWRGAGEKIIPMSEDQAFEWAQEYLDSDTVEIFFEDKIKEI